MAPSTPFTSVIICTRDRHAGFQRALASVLAQDTGGYDVIVVDGSAEPVMCTGAHGVELRVLRGEACGEGRARARGLAEATGELIAWCDDDESWTPDHLRLLRDELLAHPEANLVYAASSEPGLLAEMPVTPPPAGARNPRTWNGSQPAGFGIPSGSVLHRAEAVRAQGGFDQHLKAHAGGDLWSRMVATRRTRRLPLDLTMQHHEPAPASVAERQQAWDLLRRDWGDLDSRHRQTRGRMLKRRGNVVRFNPDTWTPERRALHFQAPITDTGSFGVVARALADALIAEGVQVTVGPLRGGHHWAAFVRDHPEMLGPAEPQDRLSLVYDWRSGAAGPRAERVALYTMWETTIVPPYHLQEIADAATMIYVPCRENVRIAQACGIEVPARTLWHGVDAARFPYLERPRSGNEPFTFGNNGVFNPRKGIDALLRAFREEFGPREPVRLLLKNTWSDFSAQVPNDPRIVPVHGFWGDADLLEFLRQIDAYILPSRGEGFGLTGLEAMATGLPLIATNWSGPADYLDPADSFPLRYTLEDTGGEWFGDRRQWGYWAEPDIQHLRELMRYLYEHREEGIARGRRASARVHRDWTWQRIAQQVIDDFDLLAQGATPVE